MPTRMLRDWTDSEKVNALTAQAETLFVRLIMKADDYGRYHGNPQLLKSYLYPLKDVRTADISRWITECEKAGLIASYEVAGKRYIEILNYGQRLRTRRESKFPTRTGNSNLSATCQQVAASCGELPLEARSEKREARKGGEENTAAANMQSGDTADDDEVSDILATCKVFSGYPKNAAEVKKLAERSGAICSNEQAEAYLLSRQATNWVLSGNCPVRNVGADLKRFLMRWAQNQADKVKVVNAWRGRVVVTPEMRKRKGF